MNSPPKSGTRIVYTNKSGHISQNFEGYDLLEVGKSYTVDYCFSISHHRGVYNLENWAISIVGIKEYGYALDSFRYLKDIRAEKLNKILN